MLSEEQITQIKSQLMQQIEENFPEDKKETAKEQIASMNSKDLEEFLKKNNMTKEKCVFCSIISEETNSYKIAEDNSAIAILEINPISEAHALIVPKEHLIFDKKIPKEINSFAKKIAKRIKSKFKSKEVKILQSELFGHSILNILPIYSNETSDSKRHKASEEELKKIQAKLIEKEKEKK